MTVSIYTDMALADYLGCSGISGSSLKTLLTEPEQWPLLGTSEPDQPWLVRGSAAHALILEGRHAYQSRFCRALDRADYPAAIETIDEIKCVLRTLGLPLGGCKSELIDRLLDVRPDYPIWSKMQAAHLSGREEISAEDAGAIERANAAIFCKSELAALVSGGLPEISIFWTEKGTSFKSRLDYLGAHGVTELKTLSRGPRLGQTSAEFLAATIAALGYDLQAAHNLYALASAKQAEAAGDLAIIGDRADLARELIRSCPVDLQFLFVRLSGALSISSAIFPHTRRLDALHRREQAIDIHKFYSLNHKNGEPWSTIEIGVDLDETAFPSWSWSV